VNIVFFNSSEYCEVTFWLCSVTNFFANSSSETEFFPITANVNFKVSIVGESLETGDMRKSNSDRVDFEICSILGFIGLKEWVSLICGKVELTTSQGQLVRKFLFQLREALVFQ